MYSELDCGICYQTYNAGHRCPRELHCKHTFCESCLRALTRPLEAGEACVGVDRLINCPLCRHPTFLSCDGDMRAELRVDESTLEQLMTAGALDCEEEEPKEDGEVQDRDPEAEDPETPPEESDSSAGGRNRRLRWYLKNVWRAIIGKRSPRGGDECITSGELRSMAMMSCYMF
ncbi:E3 ubiquitin-protein ligase-like [Melanotaenia boesemani]|uniref:E3 ubiquitin-protein ligase-like n=1 Tax=Melanotaenia boesemani TaxID=1250792 RepID=UPI001C05322C|nr:E3 ubiquitin-protein ligase-like [Melanotaenia boesemani]